MAKSARASVRKRNNANLRAKIFGPAHDARTERLSAKLQELVNAPKPEEEKAMEVDEPTEKEDTTTTEDVAMVGEEDKELQAVVTRKSSRKKDEKRTARVHQRKIAKRKPKGQVVFPSEAARRNRQKQSKKR